MQQPSVRGDRIFLLLDQVGIQWVNEQCPNTVQVGCELIQGLLQRLIGIRLRVRTDA